MGLGIAGQIVARATDHPDVARVEVAGVAQRIHVGILDDVGEAEEKRELEEEAPA
jgi:hydrogenase maturation factor